MARRLVELSADPAQRYAISVGLLELALRRGDVEARGPLVALADALGPRHDGDYAEGPDLIVGY